MKRAKPVALVGAGNLTDSPLIRFLRHSDQLGPVKSPSYRLASRISNIFRAGQPVKDYTPLNACRLILVCVPDPRLPKVLAELESSSVNWPGKTVMLCSFWLDSSRLATLSARGASVGSLSPIPGFEGFEDIRYLVEGDKLALVEVKGLLNHRKHRIIPIQRSLKPFYLAALACSGTLLLASLVAASESLRYAGLSTQVSAEILEKQFGKALRSYLRSGRKPHPPALELFSHLRVLSAADPVLAQYLEQSYRLSSRLLSQRYPTRGRITTRPRNLVLPLSPLTTSS